MRVWSHGDDIVGRIFTVDGGVEVNEPVQLAGRDAFLAWIEDWLDEIATPA